MKGWEGKEEGNAARLMFDRMMAAYENYHAAIAVKNSVNLPLFLPFINYFFIRR